MPAKSVSNEIVKNVDILIVTWILQKSLSERIMLEINIALVHFFNFFSTAWKLQSIP